MDVARAEAFCRSYGQAAAAEDGHAIARHLVFPYVSFTGGHVATMPDQADADRLCSAQIERWRRIGPGYDLRLVDVEVTPVSSTAALCRLTIETIGKDGSAGWRWDNVYGLRQQDEHQGFEFAIADNQVAELLARYPEFYA